MLRLRKRAVEMTDWQDIGSVPENYLSKKLKDPVEKFDQAYTLFIKTYSTVTEALDFVATLGQALANPIYAIVQEILSILEEVVDGFRKAGIYFTFDNALSKTFQLSNFTGGYSRFQDEITEKLTNPKDPTRPDFSRKTAVLALTFYAEAGATNVGGEVRLLIDAIRKISDAGSVLDLVQKKPVFSPPTLLPVKKYKSEEGFSGEISDFLPEDNIVGFELEWETTPSKTTRFVEVDLPPASYVITITTRAEPLPLYVKRSHPTASNPDGSPEQYLPIMLSENSSKQATTLCLPAYADLKNDDVYAQSGGVYIPYKDLLEETKTYYYNTSNLGAFFGGVNYSADFLFDSVPFRSYDIDKKNYADEAENYYIYVRAHQTELSNLEDSAEIKRDNLSQPNDIDMFVKEDTTRGVFFLTNSAGLLTPDFSEFQIVPFTIRERLNYVHALKEALLYFMVYSEYALKLPENLVGYATPPERHLSRLYNLFSVKDAKGLYHRYSSDRDDVKDFREDLLEELEEASLVALSRGLPSSSSFKVLEKDIDTLSENPIYLTLNNDFLEEPKSLFEATQDGVFPDAHMGYDPSTNNPYKSSTFYPVLRSFSDKRDVMFYNYQATGTRPLFELMNDYPEKAQAALRILGSVRDPKDLVDPTGAWIKKGFFIDVYFVEFLKQLKLVLKTLEDYIQALLKYIEILKQRIASLRAFVEKIRAIIQQLLNLKFPAGIKFLFSLSEGTQGVVESFSSAGNKPPSGEFLTSTYATLVIGGAPVIVADLISSLLGIEE